SSSGEYLPDVGFADGVEAGAVGGTMEDTTCRSTVGTIVAGWASLCRWRGAANVPFGTTGGVRARVPATLVTATAVLPTTGIRPPRARPAKRSPPRVRRRPL